MPPLDSMPQICASTMSKGKLMVARECVMGETLKIGYIFACGKRINSAMAKWTQPVGSTRQIGLLTMSKERLMVAGKYVLFGP